MLNQSPFERALQTGLDATRYTHGVEIIYKRGDTSRTISKAIQGYSRKREIEVGDEEILVEYQQWHIAVADLAAFGRPQVGDKVVRYSGPDASFRSFSVEQLDLSESAYDWADIGRTHYLIETRLDGPDAFEIINPSGFDISGNELA